MASSMFVSYELFGRARSEAVVVTTTLGALRTIASGA